MARGTRRSFPGRAIRRRASVLEWVRSTQSDTITAADTKNLVAASVPGIGLDVVVERVIVTASVVSDQNIASETQQVALGAIVATEDAFAAGAASIPGPVSDPSADWMLHKWMFQQFSFQTAAGVTPVNRVYEIESRARRRLPNDKNLVFVLETGALSAGVTVLTGISCLARLRGT